MAGELESRSDESPPLIECDLPLGRPGLVTHNELVLSGWAASHKGLAGVAVQIDDRLWNASYGLDTPGLVDRLDGVPGAERAGYRLHIDTSGWTPGAHYVTVAAFDTAGGRAAVEGPIEIRPFDKPGEEAPDYSSAALDRGQVAISVDFPQIVDGQCEVEGMLEISGWAHAADGVEAVIVTLDGTLRYEALRPIVRPDLLDRLGREAAAGAGFALRIDTVDCPPGRHSLVVSAVSRDGHTSGFECDLICHPDSKTAGGGFDRLPDQAAPELGSDQSKLTDTARMWESRALLAEADAALSRAEANLAKIAQETTLRALRDAEARLTKIGAGRRSRSDLRAADAN